MTTLKEKTEARVHAECEERRKTMAQLEKVGQDLLDRYDSGNLAGMALAIGRLVILIHRRLVDIEASLTIIRVTVEYIAAGGDDA